MRLLSDSIEDFIKALMEDEQDQQQAIELRRNELAEHFQCAPSQINYVLATRFTPDHGYVIESRRGGGGYIRIVRREIGADGTVEAAFAAVGDSLTETAMRSTLDTLYAADLITSREKKYIRSCLSASALSVLPRETQDAARAAAFRGFLLALMK